MTEAWNIGQKYSSPVSVSHQPILRYWCYAAVDESRLCKEYSTKTEKRASLPILIQVLLQSRPIANHTNMESLQSRLLLQALVSLIQICLLTISHLSIYHNTDSGSAHSHYAKLRVGPDKDWDLEWSRTNSNESQTHFSLFPLAQLRLRVTVKYPLPLFYC